MQLNRFFVLNIISCSIGDTKCRVWLPFLYPVGKSLPNFEHKRIFEQKRYITFKKYGVKTIENNKNNNLSYSNLKMFNSFKTFFIDVLKRFLLACFKTGQPWLAVAEQQTEQIISSFKSLALNFF